MSTINTIIPYETLLDATVVLAFLTSVVIVMAVVNRFFKMRENQIVNRYRRIVFPMVYKYLSGKEDTEKLHKLLNKSWYAALALRDIAFELIDDLKGSYRVRMQNLLKIEPLIGTYSNHLSAFSEWRKLEAIYYFRHLENLPDDVRDILWKYLERKSLILAHASASALMRSEEVGIRMQALIQYAEREDTTLQSFLEILHEYHRPEFDLPEIESDIVPELLYAEHATPELKTALLRCIPQFGYLNQSENILKYLEIQIQQHGESELIAECIRVLGKLYYYKAASLIRELALQSPRSTIRQACAFTLGKFGTEEDHRQIIPLLLDDHFQVRYEAATALSQAGGQVDEMVGSLKDEQIIPSENIFFEVKKENRGLESHRKSIS